MLKRIIPMICLLAVSAALVAALAAAPARVPVIPGEYDGFVINPDCRSGLIQGSLSGYDPGIVSALHGKPYFGGVRIIYFYELTQIYGGMLEIGIAESADLRESIEDLKKLLADYPAAFKRVKYSYAYLKQIEEEIEDAATRARTSAPARDGKPFDPAAVKALCEVINCSASDGSENNVRVYLYTDGYSEENIGILKSLFPYDCLVFDVPAIAAY